MAKRQVAQNDGSKAPGKRHRKPVPNEPIDKHMGERTGKQMGQKSDKNNPRGGRR